MLDGRVVAVTGDRIGLSEQLRGFGATAASLPGPFSAPDTVQAAFAELTSRVGSLDVVVHAHFPPGALVACSLADTIEADWDAHAEGLLHAALVVCQVAFTELRTRGGRIILLAPTAGLVGEGGFVPVATATEGLRALVKSAARQWGAHGITVNCVAPPLTLFGADPPAPVEPPALGRAADVEDVARVIAMLAGDAARSITGATIPVDGGVVMQS